MTTEPHAGRPHRPLVRLARFTGRTLRGEWRAIVVDPVRQLVRRGLSGLLLAFVAAFGVVFFHDIAQHPTGAMWVRWLGGVEADLPLWLSLARTPVSLYVPALDLPVWAGITQLFLAFAWAELTLGRARTLAIAYATTLAGTLTARLMIALGPGWWGFGLPPEAGHVLDTGPSAAVVGLFTYLAVIRRAPVVFTMTGGSMVWESIAVPNLAGREHLVAVGGAIVLGLLHGRGERLRAAVRSWPPAWRTAHPPTRPPTAPAPFLARTAAPTPGRTATPAPVPAPRPGSVPAPSPSPDTAPGPAPTRPVPAPVSPPATADRPGAARPKVHAPFLDR
ncbi:hypothetical protein [Streptomyces dangxiongensis]|uniref:hypothetical protein n=1 Tax=Streptomyces dangxiongensis TaxID=1442032 RepID=UPI001F092787|nr:hypothetical protein [Streptomyces dangxiongensis]